MNELEVWRGLDLSQYQLGDIIIIAGKDMIRQFRHGNWREFQQRVHHIANKLKLFADVRYNEMHDEYEIHLLEERPMLNKTAIPDAEVSNSRRKVWKRNQHVHEDSTITEDIEKW